MLAIKSHSIRADDMLSVWFIVIDDPANLFIFWCSAKHIGFIGYELTVVVFIRNYNRHASTTVDGATFYHENRSII